MSNKNTHWFFNREKDDTNWIKDAEINTITNIDDAINLHKHNSTVDNVLYDKQYQVFVKPSGAHYILNEVGDECYLPRDAINKVLKYQSAFKSRMEKHKNKKPTGKKFDVDKPQLTLLPYKALVEIAKVLMFGADKYGRDNWKGGFNWTRLADAVLRHVNQWKEGETLDSESGINHLAHAACGLMFLLHFAASDRYKHLDDREEEIKE